MIAKNICNYGLRLYRHKIRLDGETEKKRVYLHVRVKF